MTEPVVIRVDVGPVSVIKLNRPERRNALSRALVNELNDLFDSMAAEPNLRAVVLTGSGHAFCAGADLKEVLELDDSTESEAQTVADLAGIADLIDRVHHFPRPTIAAMQGDALAGGAGLAIACDFVIASIDARIAYPEVLRGLVASVVMHDLVRQIGDRRARQLLLSGELISAETAEQWGLVNEVVPEHHALNRALELAQSLIKTAPKAVSTTKLLIDEATLRPRNLRGAAAVSAAVRFGDEAREGMRAFVEKRPANWERTGEPN